MQRGRRRDVFVASTTAHLRHFLVATCPRQGASRMNRPALVSLLLDTMAQDEISSLQRAARQPISDISSLDQFLPTIHRHMAERFGSFLQPYLSSAYRRTHHQLGIASAETQPVGADTIACEEDSSAESSSWPELIPSTTIDRCMDAFAEHTTLAVDDTCAVCGRRTFNQDLLFTARHLACRRVLATTLDLTILAITDPHLLARPKHHFQYGDPSLDGIALHKEGVHVNDGVTELSVCGDCYSAVTADPPKLPSLALANDNIRGYLPEHLQDITWLEERLCAKYLASAYIVRLYDLTAPGAEEERQRVMKGHACSFPLNTVSTAAKLPWAVDGNAVLLSCIVIGPRKPRIQDLRSVFKVRRNKVQDLLLYLKEHCKGYPQVSVDKAAIQSLPEDDVPELIMRHVMFQSHDDVPNLFSKETAGLDLHPAELGDDDEYDPEPRTFLEHQGLLDINGSGVPAHVRSSAALANATGTERPDLIIRHGSTFVADYNNPDLFPGMFPTLFPWGTGGFENKERRTPLSLGHQAKYHLDLSEPDFRRHWSYVFVVANIKQRRAIHLGSRLMCQSGDFERFSTLLHTLNPAVVQRVAEHVARGGALSTLSGDEVQIFSLLKKCELVSANVPGSKAVMTRARADIRAYIGKFGIFQLFLTLNPGPSHSPVFQIFFGDRTITLDTKMPTLPSSKVRASRVADDPVAASDYFHFHINAVFQYLLGWDIRKKKSTPEGGIFGRLSAFYLVKEHSMRGQLHCHTLVWLEGGLNPSVLRARMQSDEEFQTRYLQFFDELLSHGYPGSVDKQEGPQPTGRKPRQERPPSSSDPDYLDQFEVDHSLLAHEVQRHRCTFTCFKGGRQSCRFLFPHEVVAESSFDLESNSINLRVQHPLINWHNPALLVATRHNHDLKAVQSGKSGAAAASYITSYTTKSEETPANQISMINTVYERLGSETDGVFDTRSLLSKCVMQFGRERQVHAQQAATYVRELGDTEQSHKTTPMLSGQLAKTVHHMYGYPRDGSDVIEKGTTTDSARDPGVHQMDVDVTGTNPDSAQDPTVHQMDVDVSEPILSTRTGEEYSPDGMITLNHHGLAHQVQDYLFRGPTLASLSFYDFVQYVCLIRIPKVRNKNHHALDVKHPNCKTHLHRYAPLRSQGIPRAVGASFPRSDGSAEHGDAYCSVMMAHFIPFSISNPLKLDTEHWEVAFARTTFDSRAKQVINNWAALSECDDARDADQLRRRKAEARTSMRVDAKVAAMGAGYDNCTADVDVESLQTNRQQSSAETLKFASTLEQGGWFKVHTNEASSAETPSGSTTNFSRSNRRTWASEQSVLEAKAKADLSIPTASHGILADQLMFDDDDNRDITTLDRTATFQDSAAPATERLHWRDRQPHDLLAALVTERGLTTSQSLAFNIAGRRFFEQMYGIQSTPLRMLMHGEAGTGKTVVVRLLRELMDRFGKGNEIQFLAPTGKAASAIGGMTQHAAFGIDVHRRGMTTEELQLTQHENQGKRMRFLQSSFAHVRWLFFDEVSMTSCEVFGEIDQALRIATQLLDEPFGGINVIFAGDLCQLPPVGAAPLYTTESRSSQPGEVRTKVGLGRLSWLYVDEVVEFTQQMRMSDPEMAAALTRLRTRDCTDADTALFNGNVMRPGPNSTDGEGNRQDMIVLASTNRTVRALNERKAASQAASAHRHLVISHAIDSTDVPMDNRTRASLLCYNGQGDTKVGMGRIPLYIGMPVIYRGPNKSVALGVTNGAFGTIIGWHLIEDRHGLTTPVGAIIQFDSSATWSLTGLEKGCLPVYPTSSTFTFALHEDATSVRRISRRQLPLQPGFAMTVHSAQGITCKSGVVVDLRQGGFPAYVAASRATRREDIHLIAEVKTAQLNTPRLPPSLRAELNRLELLATATSDRHSTQTWRLGATRSAVEANTELEPTPKRRRIS